MREVRAATNVFSVDFRCSSGVPPNTCKRENTSQERTAWIVDLNAEYQMAGETQTDTSKLIQERKKKKSLEWLYFETYIQPEIVGGCEQLRVAQE